MNKFNLLIALLLLFLITGCTEEVNRQTTADKAIVYRPASQQSPEISEQKSTTNNLLPQNIPFDKFSLWTGETKLRGANIYQRMVYPDVYDDTDVWGDGPLGPALTQNDFDALSEAGANLVVLSHPGIYDDKPPYSFNRDVQDNLDRLISMAENADMYVVIAARTGPGRSEFAFFGVMEEDEFGMSHLNNEVWDDFSAQAKWAEMWKQTAERYKDSPVVVGYELMVEPDANGFLDIYEPDDFYPKYTGTTHDWNQMHAKISKAIRTVDNETPILIGGLSWSNVRWLNSITRSGDRRTVYTVHQYYPQQEYTHQCDEPEGCELANTYPGRLDLDWDGEDDDFNRAWLEEYLSPIADFKARTGAPVAVTEYGIIRWEPGAAQFVSDEMAIFEKSGVSYALWSWQPISVKYTEAHNSFNMRLGPEPDELDETGSKLYDAYKSYWNKNAVRPSDYR
ncbi:glycoside hydrolase family 5 protein [Candidatus Woesearchaeota archaeon]|nr:glycoside hydrolase family 5 protein [Candidatus Woesearchaeota archaeon]